MKTISSQIFKGFLFLCLFIFLSLTTAQTVRINEFMALNQSILTDEDGEYSDWIELYNAGSSAVNLQAWGLSDEVEAPYKWIFPDVTLSPGEYLVVFASSKERDIAGNELHTNFNLNGSGEFLSLTDALGNEVTAFDPSYPEQQNDFSYGYYEGDYVEFSDPTPGESNKNSSGTTIPTPTFNTKHGFFDAPFNLEIINPLLGGKTYYTTNGSTPSKTNGTLYTGAINLNKTSVIRAISVFENENITNPIYSNIVTQSYLFLDDVIRQNNTPTGYPAKWGPYTAISGDAIGDYEMDPDVAKDDASRAELKKALLEIPTISLVTDIPNMFSHSEDPNTGGIYIYTGPPLSRTTYGLGRGWERPVSFELFDQNEISLQENCGIRIQGGHSRRPEKNPKHSFQLVFSSDYGASKLDYPLFGEDAADKHDRIILRAGFGNSWLHHGHDQRSVATYQEDIWTKDTQRDMGHPSSRSIYVHLYINGIYWGIYAPSERMDSEFGESYMGGDKDDYDVIKDYTEVSDGNITAWNRMMQMANAGLSSNDAYQRIQGNNPDGTPNPDLQAYVNVVNLADYMIINFFGGNSDWDHHNWASMRNRVNPGKGFQFLCWDAELMFGSVTSNNLDENNDNCPSRVYQQLLKNDDFKRLLADRIQLHCFNGGVLTPDANIERWMERRNMIEESVNAESARWGDYRKDVHPYQSTGPFYLYGKDNYWTPRQNRMLTSYFPKRTEAFVQDFKDDGIYPNIEAPRFYLNGTGVSGSIIEKGDQLSMLSSQGTIYYTTNGTDPVVWSSISDGANDVTLFAASATKKVLVPKSDIGQDWYTDINYDEAGWKVTGGNPGGIGYETGAGYEDYIRYDVQNEMYSSGTNPNSSCYIRISFNLTSEVISKISDLSLNMRYDDGFVAYLNGEKVAEVNAPGNITWNAVSTAGHEANDVETFNISSFKNRLVIGKNVLAIQGINQSTTSSDFIILASLISSDKPGDNTISDKAIAYTGAISLDQSAHIIARTYNNGQWSAASNKFFTIPADYDDLKITEIHYNPLAETTVDGSEFEFIEIKNTGSSTLDMGGVAFVNGFDFTFPKETQLDAGQFIVLASNGKYFYERYMLYPLGEYSGKLDNNGEKIVMVSPQNDTIISFRYNDAGDWPTEPDGEGYSLVPENYNPDNDQSNASDWRASHQIGGSPGKDDLPPNASPIIEETLAYGTVLSQNYPNPFNGITYIDYQLPYNGHVKLSVYNVMGQQITNLVNSQQSAGIHQVTWNGKDQGSRNLPNGVYFYRISVQSQNKSEVLTKSLILKK